MPRKPPAIEMVREIETWPVGRLIPYETNPRVHTKRQVAKLAASIVQFGFNQPIAVRGEVIVAGHGRLEAAKDLGLTEVPVVRLDHLTELQAQAYCVADNRLSDLSEWSPELLAGELEKIQAGGLDLELTGFSNEELEDLAGQLTVAGRGGGGTGSAASDADPGPVAPPERPTARKGDVWQLGAHRLMCGSSTVEADVDALLAGKHPVLMATDPPYGVDYDGDGRPIGARDAEGKTVTKRPDSAKVWDGVDYRQLMVDFLGLAVPRLRRNAAIYCWHATSKVTDLLAAWEGAGLLAHQVIIWAKPLPNPSFAVYRQGYEPCLFGWRQGNKPPVKASGTQSMSNVWHVDWEGRARITKAIHPTQKPLRLFEIPMAQHTEPGAIVYEPFSGSGSQLVAAEGLGRICYAMEQEPQFVDAAILRWQEMTGERAKLGGKTFQAVASSRRRRPRKKAGEKKAAAADA